MLPVAPAAKQKASTAAAEGFRRSPLYHSVLVAPPWVLRGGAHQTSCTKLCAALGRLKRAMPPQPISFRPKYLWMAVAMSWHIFYGYLAA